MNSRSSNFGLTDLLLLMTIGLWAINFTVVKNVISGDLHPIAFTALRFTLASIGLFPLLLRSSAGEQPLTRRDVVKMAGLGLLGNSLYQLMFIIGIDNTSLTNSALILASSPIFVAIFGAVLKIERLSAVAWFGIVLSFVGIGIVIFGNAPGADEVGKSNLLGDVLSLGAAIAWGAYTVLVAPIVKQHSPIRVTALSITIGTLPLLLIATPTFITTDWSKVGLNSWLGVLYSGGFAIALGYILWNRAVQHIGSARTAVYSNLNPVLAAVIAFFVRGDALTIYHLIGAVVILAGIALTRSGRSQAQLEIKPEPIEG
jgi:drug/metabolite transporter (DMT)-like permease